jgi:hypothetical protein
VVDEYGEMVEVIISKEKPKDLGEELAPMPLYPLRM